MKRKIPSKVCEMSGTYMRVYHDEDMRTGKNINSSCSF